MIDRPPPALIQNYAPIQGLCDRFCEVLGWEKKESKEDEVHVSERGCRKRGV